MSNITGCRVSIWLETSAWPWNTPRNFLFWNLAIANPYQNFLFYNIICKLQRILLNWIIRILAFHVIWLASKNRSNNLRLCIMATPVVEFSRVGYKIRKVFGKKSTVVKWNYQILITGVMVSCQTLGIILENKVIWK